MQRSDEQDATDEAARDERLFEGWAGAVPALVAFAASCAQVIATLRHHEAFGTESTLALITVVASGLLVAQGVAHSVRHRRNRRASHGG